MTRKLAPLALVILSLTGCATTQYTDSYGNAQTQTSIDGGAALGIGAVLLGAAAAVAAAYYAPPPQPVYVVPVTPVYVVPAYRYR